MRSLMRFFWEPRRAGRTIGAAMRNGTLNTARALGLIALASCCGRRDTPTSEQGGGTAAADAHALHGDFIAALKRRHWSGPDGFETCVLEPETTLYDYRPSWDRLRTKLPGLERGTYDSFSSENEHAGPVAPLDRGAMKLQVMTKEEHAQLEALLEDMQTEDGQPEDYWEVFRKLYGKAVRIGLSAPAFSSDQKQALIYYEASFGWLAAWGSYCLLKREGDRWEIADEYCFWQS